MVYSLAHKINVLLCEEHKVAKGKVKEDMIIIPILWWGVLAFLMGVTLFLLFVTFRHQAYKNKVLFLTMWVPLVGAFIYIYQVGTFSVN